MAARQPLDHWQTPEAHLATGRTGDQAGGDGEGGDLDQQLRRGRVPAGASQGAKASQLSDVAGACTEIATADEATDDATAMGDATGATTGHAASLHLDAADHLDATIGSETDVPPTTTETTAAGRDRTKEARAATKEAKLARLAMVVSRLPKARAGARRAATGATSGTMGVRRESGAVPRIVDEGLELRWHHGRR